MTFRVYCGGGKHLGDAARLAGRARFKCAPTKLDNYLLFRCAASELVGQRFVRGGSWLNRSTRTRAADRFGSGAAGRIVDFRFRCARNV